MFIKTNAISEVCYNTTLKLLIIGFLFTSCASNKSALFVAKTDKIMDTLKTVYVVNDHQPEDIYYKIKPQDIIAVTNLQNLEFGVNSEPSAIATFTIQNDGYTVLPVIGNIQLAGLTRREAQSKLQDLYSKSLLKNPIIDLKIINLKVTLLGEFAARGKFLLEKDQTSLIDIIGEVGGLTPNANPKKIKIIRGDPSNPQIIYANLANINSLGNKKLILQSNDIIYAYPKKVAERSQNIQSMMNIIQPVVLLLNSAIIIYNLSK